MPIAQAKLQVKQLVTCLAAALTLGVAELPAQARSLPQADWPGNPRPASTHRFANTPAAPSTIRNVVSCADDGSVGTLRQVVGVSGDGDVVSLTTLACSTISLASGEIPIGQNNLTIQGPSDRTVTITTPSRSSPPYNRLLHHTGTGYLTIDHLTLSNGKYSSSTGNAFGGCVNSSGGVNLYSSVVTGCTVSVMKMSGFPPTYADGAGIYAKRLLETSHSQITGNNALAFYNNKAQGGGLVAGALSGDYSTVSGNSSLGVGGSSIGNGGAAAVGGTVYLLSSTVDSNQSDVAGALYQVGSAVQSVTIRNSTISGNTATGLVGAVYVTSPLRLDNSTVAFNSANGEAAIDAHANVVAYSSIIAKNSTTTAGFADLYISVGHSLSGSHNLIVSSNLGLPDTLTSDPRLAPLANHGGATRTHALLPLSPAVDVGNNTFPLTYDQRGTGFLREVLAGSPDIGAYERQVNDDEIFYDGLQ